MQYTPLLQAGTGGLARSPQETALLCQRRAGRAGAEAPPRRRRDDDGKEKGEANLAQQLASLAEDMKMMKQAMQLP